MGMDPYIGEIILFAGNFAPEGWLPCDGRTLQISQYQALYSLLGVMYGGNGSTTFNLPDLRGRVPIGVGQGTGITLYNVGNKGGTETVTLTGNNLPAHSHSAKITDANVATSITLKASSGNADLTSPEGAEPAVINRVAGGITTLQSGYTKNGTDVDMKPREAVFKLQNVNVDVSPTGIGATIENRQPYLAMNYIIAVEGIYPIRP